MRDENDLKFPTIVDKGNSLNQRKRIYPIMEFRTYGGGDYDDYDDDELEFKLS